MYRLWASNYISEIVIFNQDIATWENPDNRWFYIGWDGLIEKLNIIYWIINSMNMQDWCIIVAVDQSETVVH